MRSIWSVARQTLSQCLRMKLAVAFILLLAISLASLPFIMSGDGTQSGGIRTVLNYSLGITGVLLSIITIFATVTVVTEDIRAKHVMMLAVKPLARWQYMLGRWFGVVLLNALLLSIAAVSTYVVLQYLRVNIPQQKQSSHDRQIIETEIFSARKELKPVFPDVRELLEKKFADLKEKGRFKKIFDDFTTQADGDQKAALFAMQKEFEKQIRASLETIGPRQQKAWEFNGLDIAGRETTRPGKVIAIDKVQGTFYRIEAPGEILGRLFLGGSVKVNGMRATVAQLEDKTAFVHFEPSQLQNPEISKLEKGSSVTVTAEPELQFRYKVKPLTGSASELFRGIAFLSAQPDDEKGKARLAERISGMGPTKTLTTVTVPAINMPTSRIFVIYANIPRPSAMGQLPEPTVPVRISYSDVSVLFKIGDFTPNFFRGVLLIFFQMMFLSALGVFCASFLAFPVASLTCFVLLGCGMIINWLADSLSSSPAPDGLQIVNFLGWLMSSGKGPVDPVDWLGTFMVYIVRILMPNLSAMAPSEKLVDGIYIEPSTVGLMFLETVILRAGLYLSIACLIYHKRELAKVQV